MEEKTEVPSDFSGNRIIILPTHDDWKKKIICGRQYHSLGN